MNANNREPTCEELVMDAIGLRYDSPEVAAIVREGDWSDVWPLVDSDGCLTGEIVDAENDYVRVDDVAMIRISDLTPIQVRANGGLQRIRLAGCVDLDDDYEITDGTIWD